MFKLSSVFILIFGLLSINTTANAYSRDFTFYNNTNRNIQYLSFAAHDSTEWSKSVGSNLGPHQNMTVKFDGVGPCIEEVKINFSNGDVTTWDEGFDFCTVSSLTLELKSNGVYSMIYK